MTYEKYDEFTKHGYVYLETLPKHWGIRKLKYLAKICNGQDQKDVFEENGKYPIYGSGGIFSSANSFLYEGSSVLLGRKGTIDKPIFVEEAFWAVDTTYYTIINKDVFPKFFYYLCNTIDFNFYKYGSAIPSMTQSQLNEIKFAYPSKLEQKYIATFLDNETNKIDTLIAEKENLIKLINEKRSALISKSVTQGINPNVEMKDSGVEYIGYIPKHWKITKLKWVLKSNLKYGANEIAEEDNKLYPRYIRITDFGDNGQLKEDTFKSLSPEIAKNYLLENGDILFARSGATVGKTFQFKNYQGIACFAGYLIKAIPNESKILSDYLYYYTKTTCYENWKNSIFIQATIQNIGGDKYSLLPIVVPQLKEQKEIVEYLDKKLNDWKEIENELNKSIELLKEIRTVLITDAVTGKIKVTKSESME